MICRFCGAKGGKDERFCAYCGARFFMEQQQPSQPAIQMYPKPSNIGSTVDGDFGTYTTTETYGTVTNPRSRADKRTVGFIIFICLAPFLIGIVSFIFSIVGHNGGFNGGSSGHTEVVEIYELHYLSGQTMRYSLVVRNGKSQMRDVRITVRIYQNNSWRGDFYISVKNMAANETRTVTDTYTHQSINSSTVFDIINVSDWPLGSLYASLKYHAFIIKQAS